MLRDNPAFAPKFDAVYGEGAADAILSEVEDTYREGPMFPNEVTPYKVPHCPHSPVCLILIMLLPLQ